MKIEYVIKGWRDPRIGDEIIMATLDIPDSIVVSLGSDIYEEGIEGIDEIRDNIHKAIKGGHPSGISGRESFMRKMEVEEEERLTIGLGCRGSGPPLSYSVRDVVKYPVEISVIYPHRFIRVDKEGKISEIIIRGDINRAYPASLGD